jgi:8-oxo-dGTP pyrophosphatase MutT (NUDIX family)/phosphohistidine phosphatase SixA
MSGTQTASTDADVLAAGVVAWRPAQHVGSAEVVLVHRPRYDDWSLPKGKLDEGEMLAEAAVRETCEETGYRVRLGARLGETRYRVPEGKKVVRYWAAQVCGGEFAPNDEVDELRWLSPADAGELMSYDWDRDVLGRFLRLDTATPNLLLVRHAKAGSRQAWNDADSLRPLSKTGLRQAHALRRLLVLFGPDRVYTAAPVRCVQTVQPLADALGVTLIVEPMLGEDAYWEDPDAGLRRFLELAAEPGVSVACSQGGVIPDVLHRLADRSEHAEVVNGPDGYPPARKASTWALGLVDERLSFADYYPHPDGS